MRHRIAGRHLSRPTNQRQALYRQLVTDFLRHGMMVTTEAKAKETKGMAEKIITLGKKGSVHARRQAAAFLLDTKVVSKVFAELGPRYAQRPGGYTRLTKLPARHGDGAAMAHLELV